MKRLFLALTVLLLCVGSYAQSSDIDPTLMDELKENIFRVGVNMDPYEYIPGPRTAVPKGYKPFYISHYGRHGSRSNWEGSMYGEVMAKYDKAHEAGILTPTGERTRDLIAAAIREHNHMNGRLTLLGQQEHAQIAARMYRDYKRVFTRGSKKISAVSSQSQRCIISMNASTAQLKALQPDLNIIWDTGETLQKYVSSDHPREVADSVAKIQRKWRERHPLDASEFAPKIFTDVDKARELVGSMRSIMDQTFWMGTTCPAFGLGDGIYRLFTWEELYRFEQTIAMDFYLTQCNSIEFGDVRMARTKPGLDDIVTKADAAIATGEYCADLRYGHDYHVLALASILGLEGVAERRDQNSCENWHGWKYTPFAANIQIIFYRSKKNPDILVKFLLNERETRVLGLEGGPYYKWSDVKAKIGY